MALPKGIKPRPYVPKSAVQPAKLYQHAHDAYMFRIDELALLDPGVLSSSHSTA